MIHQYQLNTSFKFEKQAKGFSTINILKQTEKRKCEIPEAIKQNTSVDGYFLMKKRWITAFYFC